LLPYGGVHLAVVLIVAGGRNGYLSDRHLLPLVPIAAILALRGLGTLPRWPWIAAAIAVSCIPPLLKPLHDNRVGHKHAGLYLANKLGENDLLIDPFEWAGFYSGRTVYGHPAKLNPPAMYAILDEAKGEGAHGRLQHMPEAMQIDRDPRSELVFTWPPGSTQAEAKVRVYRLETYR